MTSETRSALEALVGKWRKRAASGNELAGKHREREETKPLADALANQAWVAEQCADELSALLTASSSPEKEQPKPKRWTEVLCTKCGGNGVIKIPGGISVCSRCEGHCYEPEPASSLPAPQEPAIDELATLRADLANETERADQNAEETVEIMRQRDRS